MAPDREVVVVRALVTYVSPHGSTRGIAERVADRLRERGIDVDCRPVGACGPVEAYDAVVVGSAIHDQAWLPEASRFVTDHADRLRDRPVWLFSVGMPGALPRPLRAAAGREGSAVVAPLVALVRPRDTRLFSGVVCPQQFPRSGRWKLRLTGARFGDFRDWDAIDGWAATVADDLLATTA